MPSRPVSHSSRPGPESQTLTRLFQARSEWDRLAQLSTLLKETQIDLPDFFDSNIGATICREPNSEKLAWRLAREIARRNHGKLSEWVEKHRPISLKVLRRVVTGDLRSILESQIGNVD